MHALRHVFTVKSLSPGERGTALRWKEPARSFGFVTVTKWRRKRSALSFSLAFARQLPPVGSLPERACVQL